jgi:hypothetical protein
MPRNVVTVMPRSPSLVPGRRREQDRILAEVGKRHAPTPHARGRWLHLDFPKREDRAVVRADVVGWLDEINPRWQRYVKVLPSAPHRTSWAEASFWVVATIGIWLVGVAAIVAAVGYLIYRLV